MTLMHGYPIHPSSMDIDRVEIGQLEAADLVSGKLRRSPVTIAMEALQAGYDKYEAEDLGLLWESLQEIERDFDKREWSAVQLAEIWGEFQSIDLIHSQRDIPRMYMAEIETFPPRPIYEDSLMRPILRQLRDILVNVVYEVF